MARIATAAVMLLIAVSIDAASEYPPGYQWKTITTDHFYIHFHQGEEELARRSAAYAEGAHQKLVPMLGWTPSDRTHVILTDHVDASNGSATVFPNNRIEIYVSAPGADPSSPIEYYDNWLNLVITHEYAHILHLDQARGFAGAMRKAFGRNIFLGFPNEFSPLWMIEGLATLTESETTTTGRLKGTYLDMILRTAAVENRFATEAQATGQGPYWPSGNARYYYGAKFLSWLATTRGMDKVTEYINEYSTNVIPFRVNSTAKDVYGTSLEALWNEWSEEQQRVYRADRDALAIEGFTAKQRLTTLGYVTQYPLLSLDGTRLAFSHAGPYERPTIRVRDVVTGRELATHRINTTSALSWSPDGKRIAYSDLEFVGSFSLLSDLYVWDVDGGTRRVTTGARLKDPSFTPDGRFLIAVENRAGRNRLVEADVATGFVRPIVEPADDRQFSEPAVSHDGNRIAVAEWQKGTIDVVLYSRSGERIANLTESLARATNASPRFSADDRLIWFSSDVTGIPNIYSVPTGGGPVRRLTNFYGGALYPTSADGQTFFYSDYSSEGFDLASFQAEREYSVVARQVPETVVGNGAPPSAGAIEAPVDTAVQDYSPWRSLRPRWWFPVISSTSVGDDTEPVIGFGTAGADVLGRHAYAATITNRSYGLVYSYDRFYPTFTIAAARYDDDVVRFNLPARSTTYTETTDRLIAQVSVPWRRFQWQVVGSAGAIRDRVDGDIPSGVAPTVLDALGIFQGTLQGFRLGATFGSAREYLFSISPEKGVTASLNYESLSESLGSDRNHQQIRADVRGYLTIPYARSPLGRHVLAVRGAAGRNSGDFIFQRELKAGGEGVGDLAALDFTNFPVRGYDSGALRGQSVAIASIEYRFPLFEIHRGPTTLPLFFQRIHGDVFVDAGRAWRQRTQFATNDTISSTGAEIAADFIIGNFLPFRYRIGAAYLLRDPGKGEVQPYISIGSSF